MCTAVILRRPAHAWPLIFAANRDEMGGRPWLPPGRHWPDRPEVTAGQDLLAGGSWLGVNDHGVLAAVLNRRGSLGPAADKRSRGELVLEALDHADAADAARALSALNPDAYRSFNLVIADSRDGYWLRHSGETAGAVEVFDLPEGLSMLTAFDRNDGEASARVRHYLPRFEAAVTPDPDRDAAEDSGWQAWRALLGSREHDPEAGPGGAMTVSLASGFGTVCSAFLALPAPANSLTAKPRRPIWLFAPGPADRTAFQPIEL